MGVEAILTEGKEGIRVALPAFCLGKKAQPGVHYWAGVLKQGKIISLYSESARNYLEQIAKQMTVDK